MRDFIMTTRRIIFVLIPLLIISIMSSKEWVAKAQMIENEDIKDLTYSVALGWDQKVQKYVFNNDVEIANYNKTESDINLKLENKAKNDVEQAEYDLIKAKKELELAKLDKELNIKKAELEVIARNNENHNVESKPVLKTEGKKVEKVLMIGDSLMNEVAFGFKNNMDKSIKLKDLHKSSTGLTNRDYYDWNTVAKKAVLDYKPDVVFIHLGGNDGQDLKEKGKFVRLYSKEWAEIYQNRAEELIEEIKKADPNTKIVWIGLPAMRDQKYERKTAIIRDAQKQASINKNIIFVDGKEALGDNYVKQKKINNKIINLRRTDGIHYSREGGEQIALFAMKNNL